MNLTSTTPDKVSKMRMLTITCIERNVGSFGRRSTAGPQSARRLTSLLLALASLALTFSVSGCRSEPETPREALVRALVDRAERHAEDRDLTALNGLISDRYRDFRGNSKQTVSLLLNYYISNNQSIHVLTRTPQVRMQDSTRAGMLVFAALSGRPIPNVKDLAGIQADLYHFFVTVEEEEDGEWRITSARWERGWTPDEKAVQNLFRPLRLSR